MPAKHPEAAASRAPMNRRRFIHVIAASGAAILAGALPRAGQAAKPAKAAAPRAPKGPSPAVERELRKQETSLAETLRAVRAYELPPGSEPATVFRAIRARRSGR